MPSTKHAYLVILVLFSALFWPGSGVVGFLPRTEAWAFSGDNIRPKNPSPQPAVVNPAAPVPQPGQTKQDPLSSQTVFPTVPLASDNTSEEVDASLLDQSEVPLTSTATVGATSSAVAEPPSAAVVAEPPSASAPAQKAVTTAEEEEPSAAPAPGGGIIFNFDNAEIHEVIDTVAELLGINYTVDPKVAGTVNVHTKGEISKKDLFSVFETFLRLSGATIIRKGEFYHIIPLADANKDYVLPRLALPEEGAAPSDTFTIQVVPLKFISAAEMGKVLKPFLSPAGATVEKDTFLIICDAAANVIKLLDLIALFDVDIFEQLHLKLYEVQKADTEELALELEDIFKVFAPKDADVRSGGITVLSLPRVKLILAVSSNEGLLEKAQQWAKQLDSEASETEVKIFVYHVQNSKATDLADVLGQVFETQTGMGYGAFTQQTTFQSRLREKGTTGSTFDRQAGTSGSTRDAQQQAQQQTQRQQQQQSLQATTGAGRRTRAQGAYGGGAGAYGQKTGPKILGEEVAIVVDEMNNALIIRATDRDYRKIETTIKQLDIYPKQVLIEVLIAEIRLDDESKLGVEWKYRNDMGEDGAYNVLSKPFAAGADSDGNETSGLIPKIPSGLSYLVTKTNRFEALLRAYASKDRVNILSSPHVIAADNKEATIKITEEIPIVSGTVTTTSDTPYVTETTEYRDTGIILSVIPHINDKGLVTLDISQEVSEQSERTATGSTNPIFLKRAAETSMVVQDGQSVIIGGLIKETVSGGKSGVPVLSRIPVIGVAFGYHRKAVNRSELMLLLTPHVITNTAEADEITQEFKDKLDILVDTKRTQGSERTD